MFAESNGDPVHPDTSSQTFERIARRADVPVIRLHDLRHTHGTLLIAAGVPVKAVSERLGHASENFTIETYEHVLPGMQANAARTMEALVTRAFGLTAVPIAFFVGADRRLVEPPTAANPGDDAHREAILAWAPGERARPGSAHDARRTDGDRHEVAAARAWWRLASLAFCDGRTDEARPISNGPPRSIRTTG